MPPKRKRFGASDCTTLSDTQPSAVDNLPAVTDDNRPSKRHTRGGVISPTLTEETQAWKLTAHNLIQHQYSLFSGDQDSLFSGEQDLDSASDNSDTMSNLNAEQLRLADVNIVFDQGNTIPPALSTLISRLFDTPRRATSPKAEYSEVHAGIARQYNEEDAKACLKTVISLASASDGGHKFSGTHSNVYLQRHFLPQPNSKRHSLQQAQPDLACGYIQTFSLKPGNETPFARSEEVLILDLQVLNPRTKELCPIDVSQRSRPLFPYFTVQWKSIDAPLWKAAAQGARDGAVINENLRSIFSTAQNVSNPTEPDMLLTVHFSSAFDGHSLQLRVHWYDPTSGFYHAEVIGRFIPDEEPSMARYRRFLRNWQDEAMGPRLNAIKKAIRDIEAASTPAPSAVPSEAAVPKRPRGRPPKIQKPENRGRGHSRTNTVQPSSPQSTLRRSSRRRQDN